MKNLSGLEKSSVRKGDLVVIRWGKDKGKTGKVASVSLKNGCILIEKLNMQKRNTKPTQSNPQGGIIEKEAPVLFGKFSLVCPKCNVGVRVSRVKDKNGLIKRSCKKCKGLI